MCHTLIFVWFCPHGSKDTGRGLGVYVGCHWDTSVICSMSYISLRAKQSLCCSSCTSAVCISLKNSTEKIQHIIQVEVHCFDNYLQVLSSY